MRTRPQIEVKVGGTLRVRMAHVPLPDTAKVTIRRSDGADLDRTAVVDVALANPAHITMPAGAVGSVGASHIACSGLAAAQYPAKGEVLHIASPDTSKTQIVKVRDVDTSVGRIYLTKPLTADVAAGHFLYRTELSYTLSAEQCPRIAQNYRAVFYANSLQGRIVEECIFDVGLRPTYNPADITDIDAAWPDMHLSVEPERVATDQAEALANGWNAVQRSLWAAGKNPNRVRDLSTLTGLVVNRALYHGATTGHMPAMWLDRPHEYLSLLDRAYNTSIKQVIAGNGWYDDDDDGIATDTETDTTALAIDLQRA